MYIFLKLVLFISLTYGFIPVCAFLPDTYNHAMKMISTDHVNITLGAIMSIHSHGKDKDTCSKTNFSEDLQTHADALMYAVKMVNENQSILKDIKLGYVILDDCHSNKITLGRSLQFMPPNFRQTTCEMSQPPVPPASDIVDADNIQYYDVIGVIGALTSERTKIMANILGLFKIPHISYSSTADVLSKKHEFPYFLRTIAPDRFQVHTIADLLAHNKWTLVSSVYSTDVYGRDGMKRLRGDLKKRNICLAVALETDDSMNPGKFDEIIQKLRKHKRSRVVVAYLGVQYTTDFLNALVRNNATKEFYIVGSEAFGLAFETVKKSGVSLTLALPHTTNSEAFSEYLRDNGRKYNDSEFLSIPNISASLVMDAVWSFAYAVDGLIKQNCREVTEACIVNNTKGPMLLKALLKVNFSGSSGLVEFDESGDILGKFQIVQLENRNGKLMSNRLGTWDRKTRSLVITNESTNSLSLNVTSNCGDSCGLGEEYYFRKDSCCWECRKCGPNQISVTKINFRNRSQTRQCVKCPKFQWPDDNRSHCHLITPESMSYGDNISIVLCTFSSLGILIGVVIFLLFYVHRDDKLIRATSRELSSMILFGILLEFIVVLSMAAHPTTGACYVNYAGISLTCTAVYAPLLMKTNRVYRIFRAGRTTTVLPRCARPMSQVVLALVIIGLQLVLVTVSVLIDPPRVATRMRVPTRKLVELYCHVELASLISATSFNLILVIICIYFAFKTRKLPDNFNESRFIAFCIDTTFLLWVAFIPMYFTASRALYLVTIMAGLLLLQGYMWLACLFVPKLLTLRRQKDEDTTTHSLDHGLRRSHANGSPHSFGLRALPPFPVTRGCESVVSLGVSNITELTVPDVNSSFKTL